MITPEIYNRLKIKKTSVDDDAMLFKTLKEIRQYKYDNSKISKIIARKINQTLQYIHEPLGFWLRNPHPDSDEYDMGVVFEGNWHRLNTLDTNEGGLFKIFKDCNIFLRKLKEEGINTIKIINNTISTDKIYIGTNWTDDIDGTYEKIITLIDVVKYNGDEWLHPSNQICKDTMEICASYMLMGDTGETLFKMYINQFFKNITKLKYSTGLGDPNDRKEGVDCWITHDFNIKETIQEKTSTYNEDENGNIITSANFSETSKCTLFSIITPNNIILIRNDNSKNKKIGTTWIFHKDSIVKEIKIINMLEQLKELMKITGKNNITLTISKEGDENSVYYNEEEKNVTITFPDEYNENIITMILGVTEDLKKIFK
jgi:hypothetical protein